jgi:hypothetical protein
MRGARPGERRVGRKKGTPNKRSIPAIQAAIKDKRPDLGSLSLQRYSAAGILAEIEQVRSQKRYDADALVEERPDFAEVRADLSRLNTEQLLVLKHLALIASGGATSGSVSGGPAAPVRRTSESRKEGDR